MEENNKEKLDDVKKGAAQFKEKVTAFCDEQGEKAMSLVKKSVPAVEEYAKDPAKLNKTILIINIAATAFMLFTFYVLPATPNLKGDGSMTFAEMLMMFGNIASSGYNDDISISLILLIGRVLIFCTYANLIVGLYSLFTEKVIPYVSSRLFSLITLISMVLLLLLMISNALIGIYIALLASLVVGLSGLVMLSKK